VSKTIITQIIPTIQGEGPSVGTPILLIRIGNCNLDCTFCDTSWSNNLKLKEIKKFNPKDIKYPFWIDDSNIEIFIKFLNKEFLYQYRIHTILLSGGEPLMNKLFIRRLVYNSELSYISKIEIETNGVLLNDEEDYKIFEHWDRVIQINISPKLDPKFYRSDRIKTIDDIINLFKNNIKTSISKIEIKSPTTVTWKFVYSIEEKEKIDLFLHNIPSIANVNIMPLTPDYKSYKTEMKFLEDFRKSSYNAIEYCLTTGYIFVPRAHVWIFNNYKHRDELVDVREK
jgi:organic radical activating enzyme